MPDGPKGSEATFGCSFTYFGPMLAGDFPNTSPIVHLHGWTFFAWYLLLPFQAGLIAASRLRRHRAIGYGSIALAIGMTVTGLVVIGVQMKLAQQPGGDRGKRRVTVRCGGSRCVGQAVIDCDVDGA